MLQQLTQVSWCQFLLQIRNRLAMLLFKLFQKNVLGAQSSAFSVSNLPLPSPDSQVTMEQLQSVLTWLQQASANFIQRPNAGQCVTQHESVSQTTRHDIPTSQIDTTAHLAQTFVQSRATLFSPHYSALNSATTTNTPSSHVPLPTPGLHTFHTPTAQGLQQRTCVTAPSTGCGLYNLKQSLVLKLNESDEQANAWGKFVSDAARTHSPYTQVKHALIKRYERRAHHRLFEIHTLRLKDGESYVDFMDRLIATAGHDWESNPLKCNEILTSFCKFCQQSFSGN